MKLTKVEQVISEQLEAQFPDLRTENAVLVPLLDRIADLQRWNTRDGDLDSHSRSNQLRYTCVRLERLLPKYGFSLADANLIRAELIRGRIKPTAIFAVPGWVAPLDNIRDHHSFHANQTIDGEFSDIELEKTEFGRMYLDLHRNRTQRRTSMAETVLHKDGDDFAIVTTAENESEFVQQFADALAELIETGEYDGDWPFQIRGWFSPASEVVSKYRGYKANVIERRTLIAGHLDPTTPLVVAGRSISAEAEEILAAEA